MQQRRYLKHLDTLLFAISGFFAVQLFTAYGGIGISPDSIMYASTAESIFKHGNLITFNGTPMTFFPAGYPAFLSIFYIFHEDLVAAAPVINGLLFAAAIALCGWMITRFRSPSVIYKWLVLACIVPSPAMLEIYTYLWSETLFIFTILLFAVTLKTYLSQPALKTLFIAGAVAAVCCITRYAGVAVVATGVLLILFHNTLVFRKRVIHAIVLGITGVSILVINLIINALSTGLSTGARKPSVTSLSENLYYFGTVLCDWLGLTQQAYPFGTATAIIMLLGLAAILIIYALRRQYNRYENILTAFALVYALFILTIATISRFEQLNTRLLSPMYIPLLLAGTCRIPVLLNTMSKKIRIVAAATAVIAGILFISNYLLIDLKRYDYEFEYGVPGYTDDDWNKSEFIKFLKTHKEIYRPGIPIYSNADEAVYFFTGMRAKLVPHKFFTADVAKFNRQQRYYLIWFKAMEHPELIGLKDIEGHFKLQKLHGFDEGAVYLVLIR